MHTSLPECQPKDVNAVDVCAFAETHTRSRARARMNYANGARESGRLILRLSRPAHSRGLAGIEHHLCASLISRVGGAKIRQKEGNGTASLRCECAVEQSRAECGTRQTDGQVIYSRPTSNAHTIRAAARIELAATANQ